MANAHNLHYTQSLGIDRAHDRRLDEEWLSQQKDHPHAEVIIQYEGKFWIGTKDRHYHIAHRLNSQVLEDLTLLGLRNESPLFAATLPDDAPDKGGSDWQDMRDLFAELTYEESALLAYARAMLHWHRHHRYCGKCGGTTAPKQGGFVRQCEVCGYQIHPRTDPAIIVLIYHIDEKGVELCLLAENVKRKGTGWYSTLAGFVEPGETLEAAVVREMKEESGLDVSDLQYVASQPWPFPSALMVGYNARAHDRHLRLDENELSAARWFTRKELQAAIDCGEVMPSREDSIARFLIMRWLGKNDEF